MKRLVLASFVSSQNVFVDTALSEPRPGAKNIFIGPDGLPRDGANQFVVESPAVQTFSLVSLVVLAAVAVGIWLIKLLLSLKVRFHRDQDRLPVGGRNPAGRGNSNQPMPEWNDDRWTRFKALSAGQLFRNVYERRQGFSEDGWSCSQEFPQMTDHRLFRLVKCKKEDGSCGGHIETDPRTFEPYADLDRKEIGVSDSLTLDSQEEALLVVAKSMV